MKTAIIAAALLLSTAAGAVTTTGTAVYRLRDDDSPAAGRDFCAAAAAAAAVEKTGTTIEATTVLRTEEDGRGYSEQARRQITASIAAVVKWRLLSATMTMIGDRVAVNCAVEASFDPSDVRRPVRAPVEKETAAAGIPVGATESEVVAAAGPPRGTDDGFSLYGVRMLSYGRVWITLQAGTVTCVTRRPNFDCVDDGSLIRR